MFQRRTGAFIYCFATQTNEICYSVSIAKKLKRGHRGPDRSERV